MAIEVQLCCMGKWCNKLYNETHDMVAQCVKCIESWHNEWNKVYRKDKDNNMKLMEKLKAMTEKKKIKIIKLAIGIETTREKT